MQLKLINDIDEFDKLKDKWNAVYNADPHASVFLSWGWLRGWIESTSYNWLVLAVQIDTASPYVAFMIVGMETVGKGWRGPAYHLHMGGNPFSDHTGFVCLSEYVEESITTIATFIKKNIKWNKFILGSVLDQRLDIFLKCFSQKRFLIQENKSMSCPYIPLPENWDQYLQKSLNSKFRKNLKRGMRKFVDLNEFRITESQVNNIDSHIETLLSLWQKRWEFKSEDYFMGSKIGDVLNTFRLIFRNCFENNHLCLHIMWDGNTPIVGQASFIDKKKKIFLAYMGAADYSYDKLSPGITMDGYQIQFAIDNGFEIYDFGAGDEKYKFSFGVKERFNRNISIRQRSYTAIFRDRLRIRTRLKSIFSKPTNTNSLNVIL